MMKQSPSTTTICDFPLSTATMQENLTLILDGIRNRDGGWLVTLNTEMLSRTVRDSSYLELLHRADHFLADGMPLVWASRHKGPDVEPIKERTTGVDIVDTFLKLEEIPNFAVIGGINPAKTISQYEGATEACRFLFDGKVELNSEQFAEFARTITEKKIGIVFLALGVPKQDRIALELKNLLSGVWLIGVGGTFEILGEDGARAPLWMQKNGLEWLFRLLNEPTRLWKRYLIEYPAGVYLLIKDHFRKQEIGN